jgi:hypothetical protein
MLSLAGQMRALETSFRFRLEAMEFDYSFLRATAAWAVLVPSLMGIALPMLRQKAFRSSIKFPLTLIERLLMPTEAL